MGVGDVPGEEGVQSLQDQGNVPDPTTRRSTRGPKRADARRHRYDLFRACILPLRMALCLRSLARRRASQGFS